jgi:saxitoxin biosynthesis operon SxtJ-like protein
MRKGSFRTEREFGLIVGTIFTLLGAWWWYRAKYTVAAEVLVPLGLLLVLLGLLVPRALKYPNRAWMFLAEVLGFISTRIILGLVFYLVITPIGVFKRMFGWDPLGRRSATAGSYWRTYSERQRDPRHYEKMF